MKKVLKFIWLFSSLAFTHQAFSFDIFAGKDFNNTGTLNNSYLNITALNKIINNGTLSGAELNLTSRELTGNGLIKASYITSYSDTFTYTGTIECLAYCEFHVNEKFDQNMFTRKGHGQFKIIVSD